MAEEVRERVKRACGKCDSEIVRVPYKDAYVNAARNEDMMARLPDITKIRALIGWEPTTTLKQTIDRVIKYQIQTTAALATSSQG